MIEEKIKKLIKEALKNLNIESGNFSVEHPADLTMGDYSTNVAKLANVKKLETKNKRFTREEVADMIGGFINRNKPKEIEKVEEKAGFINFYLSRKFFAGSIEEIVNKANNVGKAIWGLLKNEKLQNKSGSHNLQATNIGQAYMHGAEAYENDEDSKKEIEEINKKIYARNDKKINEIYQWGFDVTMEAFEDLYKMLGTKFDI